MFSGSLCQSDTRAGGVHSPRGTPRAGLRRVRLPLTSADLIRAGVRSELLASLALGRASSGRVAKSGGEYFEWCHPLPSYLTGVFDELTETGCLALAAQDEWSLRRVRLTQAGQVRSAQLGATRWGSAPAPRLPAGCRLSEPPALGSRRPAGHQLSGVR
ncbi:MAG: hypothetical protein ACRDRO_15350 [Pseudonocardiaceae bacterium]